MKKQIIAGITALAVIGGGVFGYSAFRAPAETSAAEIAKEVTVSRGNVTAGVTESAAVNVESLEQTYDLVLTSTSVSASVESSGSSRGGSGMGGGMSMGDMGGMGSMGGRSGMGGNMGSTSVSTASESSSVALVVDTVSVTEGQFVQKGDFALRCATGGGHVAVEGGLVLHGKLREFKIMCGKQRKTAHFVVQMRGNATGERQSVKRAGAAPDFVH